MKIHVELNYPLQRDFEAVFSLHQLELNWLDGWIVIDPGVVTLLLSLYWQSQ